LIGCIEYSMQPRQLRGFRASAREYTDDRLLAIAASQSLQCYSFTRRPRAVGAIVINRFISFAQKEDMVHS